MKNIFQSINLVIQILESHSLILHRYLISYILHLFNNLKDGALRGPLKFVLTWCDWLFVVKSLLSSQMWIPRIPHCEFVSNPMHFDPTQPICHPFLDGSSMRLIHIKIRPATELFGKKKKVGSMVVENLTSTMRLNHKNKLHAVHLLIVSVLFYRNQ